MKIKLFFLFILISNSLFSQKTEKYSGVLTLENGTPLIFEMEFTEDKGIVNGFSITGKETDDETKSDISGIYNQNTKTYKLKETQVLYTNSEADINTFCYINMEIKEVGKLSLKRYEGEFTGYFTNGDKCASGKIILIEKEKLEKKIAKFQKKVDKKIEKEKKKNEKKKEENIILSTKVLKDDDNMKIECNSDKIRIFIWDANQEDGDKVTLKLNGKLILKDFTTKRKRKNIKIKLIDGENILEIVAINQGHTPPNTSRIEIVDHKTKYPIITQLQLGKSAIIKIVK